jgi:hypothetical protein
MASSGSTIWAAFALLFAAFVVVVAAQASTGVVLEPGSLEWGMASSLAILGGAIALVTAFAVVFGYLFS